MARVGVKRTFTEENESVRLGLIFDHFPPFSLITNNLHTYIHNSGTLSNTYSDMSSTVTKFRCIGKGFCGSVWTLEGDQTGTAIKREDGGPSPSVTNDYNMHLSVQRGALEYLQSSTPLSIPQCHQLVEAADPWWEIRLSQFPAGYSACRALVSERIPAVPRAISDNIVDLFCDGNTKLCEFVKSNPDDDFCLI